MRLGNSIGVTRRSSVGDPGAFVLALGPSAWYRYNRGITSAANAVSQWADQSGNNRHLVQATGAQQPTLDSDNSLLFDGVNDLMQASFTLAQPETVFVLWKPRRYVSGADVRWDGVTDVSMAFQDSGTEPQRRVLPGGLITNVDGPMTNNYGVHGVIYNGASSSAQYNLNTPTTGTATEAGAAGGFSLGARTGGISPAFQNVREAIVFNKVLTGGQFTQVMSYLMGVGGF